MYWIRTTDGSLANLALADQLKAFPCGGHWELRAAYSTGEIVLVVGTREECGEYRETLYSRLKERQEREDSY